MDEKVVTMAMLFDFFGELLTDKQRDCFDLYYNDDLSLSEIAEYRGISRQAVRDNIVRAEAALCELEENELTVPRQVMQEYASAAFLDYDDLLPIPAESETVMVRYDEAWDAYYVGLGDVGDSYTQIASVSQLEDGSTQVEVTMGSYDVPQMYTMQAVLAPNPYADGMADPVYLYSVSSASLA